VSPLLAPRSRRWSILAAGLLAGCAGSSEQEAASTGTARAAIIGGYKDPSREAVVAMLESAAPEPSRVRCSGTIVDKAAHAGIAFVLTESRCADDVQVARIALDAADGPAKDLPVVARFRPSAQTADASTEDGVALLTVSGADDQTPTLPILPPENDALAIGSALVFVGYGATLPGPFDSGFGENTKRRFVMRTVKSLTDAVITTGYAGGGLCWGDEGAPAMIYDKNVPYVVAVTSSFAGGCTAFATSVRLSHVASSLLAEIARKRASLQDAGPPDVSADAGVASAAHEGGELVGQDARDAAASPSSAPAREDAAQGAPAAEAAPGCSAFGGDARASLAPTAAFLLLLALGARRRRRGS